MESTFEFDENEISLEPRKSIPTPTSEKPKVNIVSISSQPFRPFTHFFLSVTDVNNLFDCEMQSLFMILRIHSTVQPIKTPKAWCDKASASFNCAYAFDFRGIMDQFSLGSFVPVIELYISLGKKAALVGLAFLQLSVKRCVNLENNDITFLFIDESLPIKDLKTNQSVGIVTVSVALGQMCHKAYLDPNSNMYCVLPPCEDQHIAEVNSQTVVKMKKNKSKKAKKKKTKKNKKKYDYYYSYYYSYSDDGSWQEEARNNHWVPPGEKFDWKARAREKNWVQPNLIPTYSVSTSCDLFLKQKTNEVEVQTTFDFPVISDDVQQFLFPNNKTDLATPLQPTTQHEHTHASEGHEHANNVKYIDFFADSSESQSKCSITEKNLSYESHDIFSHQPYQPKIGKLSSYSTNKSCSSSSHSKSEKGEVSIASATSTSVAKLLNQKISSDNSYSIKQMQYKLREEEEEQPDENDFCASDISRSTNQSKIVLDSENVESPKLIHNSFNLESGEDTVNHSQKILGGDDDEDSRSLGFSDEEEI